MNPITIIEGDDLARLIDALQAGSQYGPTYRLRIHQASDGSGVKFKINEGTWSWWIGSDDTAR